MNESVLPVQPKTSADYKAAINHCLEEFQKLQAHIDHDDLEIERLKRETRALLAQMKAA